MTAGCRPVRQSPGRRHRPPQRLEAARARFGLLLALPAALVFVAIIGYPLVNSLITSLFKASLLDPERTFVGLENFRRLLGSGRFWSLLESTTVFVLGATGLGVVLSFLWALFLNERSPLRDLVRGMSLVPWVIPSTVAGFLWIWIFHGQFGVINGILRSLGLIERGVIWLAHPHWARLVVILARTWQAMPWYTLLILAGLQSLDRQQIEAAKVDGATNLQLVTRVVIPHLRPILFLTVMIGLIGNIQHFDLIWVITGGGPGQATATFSVEVYQQAFQRWDTGGAAALGAIWTLLISVLAYWYLRALERGGEGHA